MNVLVMGNLDSRLEATHKIRSSCSSFELKIVGRKVQAVEILILQVIIVPTYAEGPSNPI